MISPSSAADAHEQGVYNVVGCAIFENSGQVVRDFRGVACVYLDNGSLVLSDARSLSFFDSKMKLQWKKTLHIHHQLNLSHDQKTILVISSESENHGDVIVRSDILKVFDLKGNIVKEFHLKPLEPTAKSVLYVYDWDLDSYPNATHEKTHVNSFYEIETNESGRSEFKAGHYIFNDTVKRKAFVLDSEMHKILWTLDYKELGYYFVHDVSVLKNGHLLFYSNINIEGDRVFSKLVELDPFSKKEIWSYQAKPPEAFYAKIDGDVQLLDDGNVLFSNSSKGCVATEIERSGKVVWSLDLVEKKIVTFHVPRVRRLHLKDFLAKNQGL